MNPERTDLSFASDLTLIGRMYRLVRHTTGSRTEAAQAALDAYCSLHPDVSRASAREATAKLIRASSEAGLICTQNW